MKLEECRVGLLVSIRPSNKGRKAKSNFGEIVGICWGYVLVKRNEAKRPQLIHPDRLVAVKAYIGVVDADEVIKKGIKIC